MIFCPMISDLVMSIKILLFLYYINYFYDQVNITLSNGCKMKGQIFPNLNPSPHMPILGSSNSTASSDMMSKIWTNGDTII